VAKGDATVCYVNSSPETGPRLGNRENGAKAVEVPVAGTDRNRGDDVSATHT
jgi:hypothetical protein